MLIEVWSDFVCPFCYIGKRRLENALAEFPHADDVEVVFKSFQLDPDIPRHGNPSVQEFIAQKYGTSQEQAAAQLESVAAHAAEVGLTFDFASSIQTNTFDAHRLAHFAQAEGLGLALTERLLKAHFTEGLHVGDVQVLADLAAQVGLDGDEARQVLSLRDTYAQEVAADIAQARQIGVRGVPFFLLKGKYGISGAQPEEVFSQALQQAWAEK